MGDAEVWREIPGFRGRYEVSDQGRVRSIISNVRILAWGDNGTGYFQVSLTRSDGKRRMLYVHRLVMMVFVGDSEMQVNHKNGDKSDNRLVNLEYCLPAQNMQHAVYVLGKCRGSSNHHSLLTEEKVLAIRKEILDGKKQRDIALRYGVTRHAVYDIATGRNWGWL